jgi:hypothetical protein
LIFTQPSWDGYLLMFSPKKQLPRHKTWFEMTFVPTYLGNICFTIYYLHKVYFSCQNSTFSDGKVWPGSGSRWIRFGLAFWIRIRIRIHIEVKSWTRTRIETNADPKHWFKFNQILSEQNYEICIGFTFQFFEVIHKKPFKHTVQLPVPVNYYFVFTPLLPNSLAFENYRYPTYLHVLLYDILKILFLFNVTYRAIPSYLNIK